MYTVIYLLWPEDVKLSFIYFQSGMETDGHSLCSSADKTTTQLEIAWCCFHLVVLQLIKAYFLFSHAGNLVLVCIFIAEKSWTGVRRSPAGTFIYIVFEVAFRVQELSHMSENTIRQRTLCLTFPNLNKLIAASKTLNDERISSVFDSLAYFMFPVSPNINQEIHFSLMLFKRKCYDSNTEVK